MNKPHLDLFKDPKRFIGVYSLEGHQSWRSPFQSSDFESHKGNALEFFIQDILEDTMRKNIIELGSLEETRKAIKLYFNWEKR